MPAAGMIRRLREGESNASRFTSSVERCLLEGEHVLKGVRNQSCLLFRYAAQVSDEPRSVHRANLIQDDLPLPAPESDIHPCWIVSPDRCHRRDDRRANMPVHFIG